MTEAASELVTLDSIFDVNYGNKFDLNKMSPLGDDEEPIAFVGRSGNNNGVSAWVGPLDGVQPYEAGLITVALGGVPLATFIQVRPFYTAQNVAVLRPKEETGFAELLYYTTAIKANQFRYSAFGREANRTLAKLLLPAQAPAWVDDLSFPDLRKSDAEVWPLLRNALVSEATTDIP